MKEGIHPNYQECTVVCNCGNTFLIGTTNVGDLGSGRFERQNAIFLIPICGLENFKPSGVDLGGVLR